MQISLSFSSQGYSQALSHMDTTPPRDAGRITPKRQSSVPCLPAPSKLANTGPGLWDAVQQQYWLKDICGSPLPWTRNSAEAKTRDTGLRGVELTVILRTTVPL